MPIQTALKAALYLAMRSKGMTKVHLASALNTHERQVRRILSPHHKTQLPTIERALAVLGQRIELLLTDN